MAEQVTRVTPSWSTPSAGSADVFGAFYEKEFRSVVALAYVLSGDWQAAEDIAQDAFVIAHRKWAQIASYERPDAWVRRVASDLAVSALRRRRTEAKALLRLARRDHATPAALDPRDEDFWAAVRALPKRQAQVVALYYLEDLSVARIAELMGCAEGTVKAHLHKARMNLAAALGTDPGGDA